MSGKGRGKTMGKRDRRRIGRGDAQKEKSFLWLGCTTRYFLPQSAVSAKRILKRLGITSEVLDRREDICCGSVLFNTGKRKEALENMKGVRRLLRSRSVGSIITVCPGCAKTFKEHYGLKDVKHIVEIMAEKKERLRLRNDRNIVVTYHDPCHLGRGLRLYEPPRTVINAVPKVTLREMRMNRDRAFCCGSGGGLRAHNKELADFASGNRLNEANATGATYLVTACPFCERSFKEAQATFKGLKDRKMRIVNIVDFVNLFMK